MRLVQLVPALTFVVGGSLGGLVGLRAAWAADSASCQKQYVQTVPNNPFGRSDGKSEKYVQCGGPCPVWDCQREGQPTETTPVNTQGSVDCICWIDEIGEAVWDFANSVAAAFGFAGNPVNPYVNACSGSFNWVKQPDGRTVGTFTCPTGPCGSGGHCTTYIDSIYAQTNPPNLSLGTWSQYQHQGQQPPQGWTVVAYVTVCVCGQ